MCSSCKRGKWTAKDIEFLVAARVEGMTLVEIAFQLQRPLISVQRKLSYLKVYKPEASQKRLIECSICGRESLIRRTTYYAKKDSYICRACRTGCENIGSIRKNNKGYTQIKMATHPWQMKHILLWILHNGPIPPGQYVDFKDGNKNNLNIDNLILRPLQSTVKKA